MPALKPGARFVVLPHMVGNVAVCFGSLLLLVTFSWRTFPLGPGKFRPTTYLCVCVCACVCVCVCACVCACVWKALVWKVNVHCPDRTRNKETK